MKNLSIAVTAVFSIGMFVFMKPVFALLGESDNTFHYARQYAFCVIVLGGIPTVLSNVMANLLRSGGMSKEAGFGITMGGIINMPLVAYNYSAKNHERMNHIIGMYGIVWSQVCADILTVSLSFYVYRRYTHTVLLSKETGVEM